MSNPYFTPIPAQIQALEASAQGFFDKAETYKRAGLAEAAVRFNAKALKKLDEAAQLRAAHDAKRFDKRRERFFAKALEAQRLAHAALQARAK